MPTLPVPTENVLLAMLPSAVNERLQGESVIVTANAGDVLLDAGERIEELYFPLDLVVSSDQKVDDEATDESG